jgi:hypothetical protein
MVKEGAYLIGTAIPIIIEGRETAFNSFLVPVYYWKTVEKPKTDPQLLWEWQ